MNISALLQGKLVRLRALEKEDLEKLYSWENNPEVWEVSGTTAPFSKYTLEQFILSAHQDIYTNKQLRLIIEEIESSEALGSIDFFDFDPQNRRGGIGILIASKEHRKKGFASEALELFIEYAFRVLDLHQLYASVTESNEESLQLFLKKKFQISGKRKEWILVDQEWKTELFLQLINSR